VQLPNLALALSNGNDSITLFQTFAIAVRYNNNSSVGWRRHKRDESGVDMQIIRSESAAIYRLRNATATHESHYQFQIMFQLIDGTDLI